MTGRFYSDCEFPDQYHGVLIRSSIQRGRLVDIKAPPLPDDYHLYTATDIPGENRLSAMGTNIPVFAPYEIQYFGEPLGIIVGPDLETVHELVSNVLIETEPLEPLTFSEKFPASQIVSKKISFFGDVDRPVSDGGRVVETVSSIGIQDHYYAEPLGVSVTIANGKLQVFTATQWPFHVRSSVSAVLDLDADEIVVTPTVIGEDLDGKIWYPSLLAAQASLAAVLCKHPVRIAFSRQEDFLFSVKSASAQIRYRSSVSADGGLESMSVRILLDAGAWSPLIDEIVERMCLAATGFYTVANFRVEAYALRTSIPPMGAMSGWGEAKVFFALETHVAEIARQLGLSPVEWKLMNVGVGRRIPAAAPTIRGQERLAELFNAICTESDFPRKYTAYDLLARHRADNRDGPLRGIGIVAGFQGNGFSGKIPEKTQYTLEMTMQTDGQVRISACVHSAPMRKIIQSIVGETLGIETHLISFTGVDTDAMSPAGPETLSSKIAIMVPLAEKCSATIQKQRFRSPLPITVRKTYKPSRADANTPFVSVTPGACAVELELDPLTYEPLIRGIWIACDAGRMHDEKAARTTIRKTIPTALSRTLAEHIIVRDGRFVPKDSLQYDILPPTDIPEATITFLASDEPARGIGTIAQALVPAAYAAALAQITGSPVTEIPLDSRMIYEALERPEAQP